MRKPLQDALKRLTGAYVGYLASTRMTPIPKYGVKPKSTPNDANIAASRPYDTINDQLPRGEAEPSKRTRRPNTSSNSDTAARNPGSDTLHTRSPDGDTTLRFTTNPLSPLRPHSSSVTGFSIAFTGDIPTLTRPPLSDGSRRSSWRPPRHTSPANIRSARPACPNRTRSA